MSFLDWASIFLWLYCNCQSKSFKSNMRERKLACSKTSILFVFERILHTVAPICDLAWGDTYILQQVFLETFWFSSLACQCPRALSRGRGTCLPCFTLSSSATALFYLLSLLPLKQLDAPVGRRPHADRWRNVQQQLQTCRVEQNHTRRLRTVRHTCCRSVWTVFDGCLFFTP